MNQRTVRTAGQASVILFIVGLLVMAPPLRFALFMIAAFCAIFPAVFSSMKWRIIGVMIVIIALIFSFLEWPDAKRHMKNYRERSGPGHQVSHVQELPPLCRTPLFKG